METQGYCPSDDEMRIEHLEAVNAELVAALEMCERALEERDAEQEEYAAKLARAALAKARP